MCFILLGGVLTSFFLYIGLVTMFTDIVLIFDDVCLLHLSLHVLFDWCKTTSAQYRSFIVK